ncbi:MAG: dTDP-4-dehydrorhamnose reductase [Clostridia bacterium]|nr:dTDP-4-dehydrorhamnose reductase [Clostridia bacterium]
MKILVTGCNGQLGHDVIKTLKKRNIECLATDVGDFDITDALAARVFIEAYCPDAVIHCAAYTAVDRAEDDEENCRRVNVLGTENIAAVCADIGAKLLYVSTDYVYGGGSEPHEVGDPVAPINVYGKTKLEGELAVRKHTDRFFIVRTSWVFGKNGSNFVKTMLRLGEQRDSLTVVCDQIGSPTYTPDLAAVICDMVTTEKYGVYHATNENTCSWAEFAAAIMERAGLKTRIIPIPTSEYKSRAQRPLNSVLSKRCLDEAGFERLPTWQNALDRYLVELGVSKDGA